MAKARTPGTVSDASSTKVSRSFRGSRFRRAVSTMKFGAFVVAASEFQNSHSSSAEMK